MYNCSWIFKKNINQSTAMVANNIARGDTSFQSYLTKTMKILFHVNRCTKHVDKSACLNLISSSDLHQIPMCSKKFTLIYFNPKRFKIFYRKVKK